MGMRRAQVHSTCGAAREAAQAAAAQAEAALMAAKEKAAQTASQVCPFMFAQASQFVACVGQKSRPRPLLASLHLFVAFKGSLNVAKA